MERDSFQLHAFGASDAGLIRDANEDAFYISEEQGLFIVSDGMGGARAGALASSAVVQLLPLQVAAERMARGLEGFPDPAHAGEGLVRAIGHANEMLLEKTRGVPETSGLGATVVAGLYAGEGVLALAHLGDSRAYLMRHGVLEQLTSDHTVVNVLVNAKCIKRDEIRRHPARHILTRHIGLEDCPEADIGLLPLLPGDRILLCSDGLTGMLINREIGQILWDTKDRAEACRRLIARAKEEGGRDNITVVIMDAADSNSPGERQRTKVVVRGAVGLSLLTRKPEEKQEENRVLTSLSENAREDNS